MLAARLSLVIVSAADPIWSTMARMDLPSRLEMLPIYRESCVKRWLPQIVAPTCAAEVRHSLIVGVSRKMLSGCARPWLYSMQLDGIRDRFHPLYHLRRYPLS